MEIANDNLGFRASRFRLLHEAVSSASIVVNQSAHKQVLLDYALDRLGRDADARASENGKKYSPAGVLLEEGISRFAKKRILSDQPIPDHVDVHVLEEIKQAIDEHLSASKLPRIKR